MDRYRIALGEKSKKIKLKKPKTKNIPKNLRQSYFTHVREMIDYMTEIGGTWISEEKLIYENEPLIGYKGDNNEIVMIKVDDYLETKKFISEKIRGRIDQEVVIKLPIKGRFLG